MLSRICCRDGTKNFHATYEKAPHEEGHRRSEEGEIQVGKIGYADSAALGSGLEKQELDGGRG